MSFSYEDSRCQATVCSSIAGLKPNFRSFSWKAHREKRSQGAYPKALSDNRGRKAENEGETVTMEQKKTATNRNTPKSDFGRLSALDELKDCAAIHRTHPIHGCCIRVVADNQVFRTLARHNTAVNRYFLSEALLIIHLLGALEMPELEGEEQPCGSVVRC